MIESILCERRGWCFGMWLFALAGSALPTSALAQQMPPSLEFPRGTVRALEQLPIGRFRTQLEQLPRTAQARALQWLNSVHFTEQDLSSLHLDPDGGVFYVCIAEAEAPSEPIQTPEIVDAALPISPFPQSLVFHSRPGSPNLLYLNFQGENVINTEWNTQLGRTEIPAMPFSSDTDYTTYSDAEQVAIQRIWLRIAEDYAPFDIDVTTERPATFNNRTAVALITRKTDALGYPNPHNTGGGVAYLNVFGTTGYARYRPAWIYHDNLSHSESYIAEAISHEIGHNMGLSHDGTTDGSTYYGGHGSGEISWGPIMGTGYNRNVSHWCKGDYYHSNNSQDDLATIAAKITYRADDHGNTAGTATPLLLSGGTNIVSTTPLTDPLNLQPQNKGVLERNNDQDVFSFVTGNGPVRLAVSPWLMPSGTRGGNVDLLVELYNDQGALMETHNPASQTAALIQSTLPEGRYYLHIRNSDAGDPFSSTPTGYTPYSSLGQFFINGYLTAPTALVLPPRAEISISELVNAGQTAWPFHVTYSDDVAVDISTLDSNDIRVTGPNGYEQPAQWLSLDVPTNGTPRVASYAASPPSGSAWIPAHNGTYTFWLQGEQVADTQGAWAAPALLGQFAVSVPTALYIATMDSDPGWTLEPQWQYGIPSYFASGPVSGYTGTRVIGYNLSGNYGNNLTAKYATTPRIYTANSSSLILRFKRWLRTRPNDTATIQVSPDGFNWTDIWSTSDAVTDTAWQEVQHPLPASIAGTAFVWLRWGLASNVSQSDIGWNIDDVELLGDGALDATPPFPMLSVADLTLGGSPSHSCSVTYVDDVAVRLDSLDSADLLVIGPQGSTNRIEFVGADLPIDGSPLTGTYSILAPGGFWDATDNGTYTISLVAEAVTDISNNLIQESFLGSFQVNIEPPPPGILSVTPADDLVTSGTVAGPYSSTSAAYTLSNTGGTDLKWSASKSAYWLNLTLAGGTLSPGESASVIISLNDYADALAPGTYADIFTIYDDTKAELVASRSVQLTVTAPGQLEVTPLEESRVQCYPEGQCTPSSLSYELSNSGDSPLTWTASVTADWLLVAQSTGTLQPGDATTLLVSIDSGLLGVGEYHESIVVSDINTAQAFYRLPVYLRMAVLPVFVSHTFTQPGLFEVAVQASPGTTLTIESSGDLQTWLPISTNPVPADGILRISHPRAESQPQWYRARAVP